MYLCTQIYIELSSLSSGFMSINDIIYYKINHLCYSCKRFNSHPEYFIGQLQL